MVFRVVLDDYARKNLSRLDKSVREAVCKRLHRLELDDFEPRHLKHGVPFFVEEVGQYRICFKIRYELGEKRVYFIGDHDAYGKWLAQQ